MTFNSVPIGSRMYSVSSTGMVEVNQFTDLNCSTPVTASGETTLTAELGKCVLGFTGETHRYVTFLSRPGMCNTSPTAPFTYFSGFNSEYTNESNCNNGIPKAESHLYSPCEIDVPEDCQAVFPPRDNVLFIGDSWAALAKNSTIQQVCPGAVLANEGQGGTTASQWAAGTTNPTLSSILAAQTSGDVTSVWVSVFGNDLLSRTVDCPESFLNDTVANVLSVVQQTLAALPNATVFLTGYGRPSTLAVFGTTVCSIADFDYVTALLESAALELPRVSMTNVSFLFGGGPSTPSDAQFYADTIHLNDAGYLRLFSQQSIFDELCRSRAGGTPGQLTIPPTTYSCTGQDVPTYSLGGCANATTGFLESFADDTCSGPSGGSLFLSADTCLNFGGNTFSRVACTDLHCQFTEGTNASVTRVFSQWLVAQTAVKD